MRSFAHLPTHLTGPVVLKCRSGAFLRVFSMYLIGCMKHAYIGQGSSLRALSHGTRFSAHFSVFAVQFSTFSPILRFHAFYFFCRVPNELSYMATSIA